MGKWSSYERQVSVDLHDYNYGTGDKKDSTLVEIISYSLALTIGYYISFNILTKPDDVGVEGQLIVQITGIYPHYLDYTLRDNEVVDSYHPKPDKITKEYLENLVDVVYRDVALKVAKDTILHCDKFECILDKPVPENKPYTVERLARKLRLH